MKTILCYGDSNLRGFLLVSFNGKSGADSPVATLFFGAENR
jgi:hypothetical protein